MQLTADIFNLPATRLSNTEVCAAGAAINAGIWAGIYKDYEDVRRVHDARAQDFLPDTAERGNIRAHLPRYLQEDLYEKQGFIQRIR